MRACVDSGDYDWLSDWWIDWSVEIDWCIFTYRHRCSWHIASIYQFRRRISIHFSSTSSFSFPSSSWQYSFSAQYTAFPQQMWTSCVDNQRNFHFSKRITGDGVVLCILKKEPLTVLHWHYHHGVRRLAVFCIGSAIATIWHRGITNAVVMTSSAAHASFF